MTLFNVGTTLYKGKTVQDDFINAYRFQVLTGLRPGELVGLQWNDIHGNTVQVQRAINVRGEVTRGKNENAVRSFVLSTMARRVLDEQRKITGDAGSVFCIMREKTYYSRWKAYCKANGLTPCSLYELRHTFVSVVKTLPAGGGQRPSRPQPRHGHIRGIRPHPDRRGGSNSGSSEWNLFETTEQRIAKCVQKCGRDNKKTLKLSF